MDRNTFPIEEATAAGAVVTEAQTWAEARSAILPLLPRRRPPPLREDLVTVHLEPGVQVGFGVDLGPMFLRVTESMLRRWDVDPGRLARQAIGNLRHRAERLDAGAAVRTRFGLTPLWVLQAPDGSASSLILAPDLLPRWFGEGPRVFIAPARNLLVGLPSATDRRLVCWLRDAIAGELPDALDVPALWCQGARTTWYTAPNRSVR